MGGSDAQKRRHLAVTPTLGFKLDFCLFSRNHLFKSYILKRYRQVGKSTKEIFARNLKRLMEMREKTTQEHLAEVLDVAQSAVSGWCSGGKFPEIDTVERIAGYFNTTVTEILKDEDSEEQVNPTHAARSLDREALGEAVQEVVNMEADAKTMARRAYEVRKRLLKLGAVKAPNSIEDAERVGLFDSAEKIADAELAQESARKPPAGGTTSQKRRPSYGASLKSKVKP